MADAPAPAATTPAPAGLNQQAPTPQDQAGAKAPGAVAKGEAQVRGPDGKFQKVEAKGEAPKEAAKQRVKIIADGQEEEVELEEALKRASKATAADKRFREASELKKQTETQAQGIKALLHSMKESPEKFARELEAVAKQWDVDPLKIAEALFHPHIQAQLDAAEEATLTPEQLQAKKERRELEEYRRREAQAKEAAERAEKEKAQASQRAGVEKYRENISNTVLEALQALKDTGVPQTHETAFALSDIVGAALMHGVEVSAKDVAQAFLEQRRAEWHAALKAKPDPTMVPKELLELARKQAIEEHLKNNPMAMAKPVSGRRQREEEKATPKRTVTSIQRDLLSGTSIRDALSKLHS